MFLQTCMYAGCTTLSKLSDCLYHGEEEASLNILHKASQDFVKYLERWIDIIEYSRTTQRTLSQALKECYAWCELFQEVHDSAVLDEVVDLCKKTTREHPLAFMRELRWNHPERPTTEVLTLNGERYFFRKPCFGTATTHNLVGCVAAYTPQEKSVIERAFLDTENAGHPDSPKTMDDLGLRWVSSSRLNLGALAAFKTEQSYLLTDFRIFTPRDVALWVWKNWIEVYGTESTGLSTMQLK